MNNFSESTLASMGADALTLGLQEFVKGVINKEESSSQLQYSGFQREQVGVLTSGDLWRRRRRSLTSMQL